MTADIPTRTGLAQRLMTLGAASVAVFASSPERKQLADLQRCGETALQPLPEVDRRFFAEKVRPELHSGSQRRAGLARVAATLFLAPHELDDPAFDAVPLQMLEDYLRWALTPPALLTSGNDGNTQVVIQETLLAVITARLAVEPESPFWNQAAAVAVTRLNLIAAYMSTRNLKALCRLRAELLDRWLRRNGHAVDWAPPPRRPGRIRLGVLLGDLTPRTETFTTLPVFAGLDRSRYEVTIFLQHPTGGAIEQARRAAGDSVLALPEDTGEAVRLIRSRDLDILHIGMNVTAVTHRVALVALHKLARVQCTGFSSPITTGFPSVDFYVSGELSDDRAEAHQHYTETPLLLPGAGFCFDYSMAPAPSVRIPDRRAMGTVGRTVFVSGANFYKIGPDLRASWTRILASVPGSLLVLYPFSRAWSSAYPEERFLETFKAELSAAGVVDGIRIIKGLPTRSDVVSLLRQCDIYLDSFPYGGANTTFDPLEAGLPVVAAAGATLRNQQGAAMLLELGLGELVCQDAEAYVARAVRLGLDAAYRKAAAAAVTAQMAKRPTFADPAAYGTLMDLAFRRMLERKAVPLAA
ncbi:O-linked N-acetylglucosamine transferase family protein [Arenibaculum pallidiluteum]|uniref:O-linked N-acetylglucosamine transferase family protein n=1 Tax=Arenibaculum pallidiluteum TaxID=2812559 RepID=UPI001A9645C9|nr:hypothetical protein [Arenibaculum pallidiluteum]